MPRIRWFPTFILGQIFFADAVIAAGLALFFFARGAWPLGVYFLFGTGMCLVATKWINKEWLTKEDVES